MATLASTLLATVVVVAARARARGVGGAQPPGRHAGSGRCWTRGRRCRRSCTWCRSWRCSAPSRFTAIVAAVVFAVPVTIKIVADGIRAVPVATVEAANSVGSSSLADDQQGAAADGPPGDHARGQPGPDLRAVDGRRRRPGRRRRARLRRRRRILAERAVRQGAGRRAGDRAARRHARPHHAGGGPPYPELPQAEETSGEEAPVRRCADGGRRSRWPGAVARRSARTQPAATGGKECGTFNLTVNPWVGYEANAAVVAYVATKDLGCKVAKKNLKEEIAWQGFEHRRGRRDPGELGPRGPEEEVHHRPEGRGRGRLDRDQRRDRLVRAAVDGRRSTRTSPTGRTSTSTPPCSRRRSPAARASCSTATRRT